MMQEPFPPYGEIARSSNCRLASAMKPHRLIYNNARFFVIAHDDHHPTDPLGQTMLHDTTRRFTAKDDVVMMPTSELIRVLQAFYFPI